MVFFLRKNIFLIIFILILLGLTFFLPFLFLKKIVQAGDPVSVTITVIDEPLPVPPPLPPPPLLPPPLPLPPPPLPIVETRVILIGRAQPLSSITILEDGRVIGIVLADSLANFRKEIVNITPGIRTFGLWSEDREGRRSRTLSFTTNVRAGMITTINGIFLPPTINLDRIAIPRGETLNILGMTAPQSNVSIFINSSPQIIRETQAGNDGIWFYAFNTAPLEIGSHNARARATDLDGLRSIDSQSLAFNVGEEVPEIICPRADLNRDRRTNLIDFSILLFWWGRFDPCVDQNQDRRVNLIDFSIMMYWWTG
jgi:hypothetical protein